MIFYLFFTLFKMNMCNFVSGRSLISTLDGLLYISEMCSDKHEIVGSDNKLHISNVAHKNILKEAYTLKTSNGYSLILGQDHLVLTQNRGDVNVKNLVQGDLIMLSPMKFGNKSINIDFLPSIIKFLKNLTDDNTSETIDIGMEEKFSIYTLLELKSSDVLILFTYLFNTHSDFNNNVQNLFLKNMQLITILQLLLLGFNIKASICDYSLVFCFNFNNNFIDMVCTDSFKSLTYNGIEDVYNLIEPVTSHYVANGIVVHN